MSGIYGYAGNEEHISQIKSALSSLKRRGEKGIGITLKCEDSLYYASEASAKPEHQEDAKTVLAIASSYDISKPACNGRYSVVADGENGDEERILELISNATGDKIDVIEKARAKQDNLPTFAFISSDENALYISKGNAPLYIGYAHGTNYIASELVALFGICEKYTLLDDGDMAKITPSKATIYDSRGRKTKRSIMPLASNIYVENSLKQADEIFYCPNAIRECVSSLTDESKINLGSLKFSRHMLDRADRIIITSEAMLHPVAKAHSYNFELLTDIETLAIPSSELMETIGIITRDTIVICLCDRGEDMSVINATKRAKYNDARVIAITSSPCSYLAMLSDYVINPKCDFPKNCISLKSFGSQYFALALLGVYMSYKRGYMTEIHTSVTVKMAQMLSGKISSAIKPQGELVELARNIRDAKSIIFTGYAVDYALAQELANKTRKIGNKSAFAMRLEDIGDMADALVIMLASNECYIDKISGYTNDINNMILCTTEGIAEQINFTKSTVGFGDNIPLFNPIIIASGFYKAILLANDEASTQKQAG